MSSILLPRPVKNAALTTHFASYSNAYSSHEPPAIILIAMKTIQRAAQNYSLGPK
nr:hypothetical protein [Candidatus Njordarchaeota archaeon]